MISYRWGGVEWGGTKTFMFLCTHGHSNLIIFLAVLQTQALLFHDHLPVGWGGTKTFMFLCTQRHCSFIISYRWGGVRLGATITNNVHVSVHTQAQQPHHLSCCPADTGTALSWSLTGGVGWGATITFMFLSTHRHSNLIIFLAVLQTQALLFHDHLPVGWGGTITLMFLCTHRHSNLIIFLAVLQTQALLFHDHLPVEWGGVGQ